MNRNYNYQAFTPEEVEQGLFNDLLTYLLDYNKKNTKQYYDIHITTDGYCSIVEWTDVSYNGDYQERLNEFLEKNPGWEKTEYGTWTNRIENEQFRKWLENPCEHCVDDANNPTKDCSTCQYNHEDMDGDVCSECEDDCIKSK